MKISRINRLIIIGVIFMMIGGINIWYGSVRTSELKPLVQSLEIKTTKNALNIGSNQPGSQNPSIASLRPIAALEFYQFVVTGGKVVCALGAFLLALGISLLTRKRRHAARE